MKSTLSPLAFLQRQKNFRTWCFTLLAACLGSLLALLFICFGPDLLNAKTTWHQYVPSLWFILLGATGLFSLTLALTLNRLNRHKIQKLDEQLGTQSRLEAAYELRTHTSALAEAQRAEAEQHLAQLAATQNFASTTPLFLLSALLFVLAALNLGLGYHQLTAKYHYFKPQPVFIPKADIHWDSPEAEIKATKLEEVPLTATVTSDSGVHNFKLELSINGKPIKATDQPKEPFNRRGTQHLKTSIPLDELTVEPYDIVSYNLSADRNTSLKLPATRSPLQFIEIRPFREDALIVTGGDSDMFHDLINLKAAQLGLLKRNFILANSDLPKTDPSWKAEHQHVTEDQGVLVKKTGELIQKMIDKGYPTELVDSLMKAKPEMEQATSLLTKNQNLDAATHQEIALSILTEVEKYFIHVMPDKTGHSKGSGTPDPFKDEQKFTLKMREETQAGSLEKAAQMQNELLKALDNKSSTDLGKNLEKEQKVGQMLQELENRGAFSNQVMQAIKQAHNAANEAATQLEANDTTASREPATRAKTDLDQALNLLREESKKSALATLEQAQRELNNAATELRRNDQAPPEKAATAGTQVKKTQKDLQNEATHQQELGDASIATQLAKLAEQIQTEKVLENLKTQALGGTDKSEEIAKSLDKIAHGAVKEQLALAPGREYVEKMAATLKKAQKDLDHLAHTPGLSEHDRQAMEKEIMENIETAAQATEVASANPETQNLATNVLGGLTSLKYDGPYPVVTRLFTTINDPLNRLIDALNKETSTVRRQEIFNADSKEEMPAKYKKPVADYFEQLSKDYQTEKKESP